MSDIKKAAKDGQMGPAKIMAKDLVRTRAYIKKMHKMKSHMEAVSLRLQTMSSTQQMAQCMKGVTKAMGMMNKKMNLPQISKIMQEFDKQNQMMDMKDEMMSDQMDDAPSGQVAMPSAGGEQQQVAATAGDGGGGGGGDDLDDELQRRLDNLRRT